MKYNNFFIYDGMPTNEWGLIINGDATWDSSEWDIATTVKIPGRSGDLFSTDGRYKNFKMEYKDCWLPKNFHTLFPEIRSFFLARTNRYYKLEDTYHPNEYLRAVFDGTLKPSYDSYNDAGKFDITFNCMPQRWLKQGDAVHYVKSGDALINPTRYDAKPLLRVFGYGALTVGDITLHIAQNNFPFVDVDCDMYDAYCVDQSANEYLTFDLTNKYFDFPVFKGSEKTRITYDNTIEKLEVYPRWWTI